MKTAKYIMVELVFKEQLQQDQALHLPAVPVIRKIVSCVQECVESLKKLRHDVWYDGENEFFNMEFIQYYFLIMAMSISIQN